MIDTVTLNDANVVDLLIALASQRRAECRFLHAQDLWHDLHHVTAVRTEDNLRLVGDDLVLQLGAQHLGCSNSVVAVDDDRDNAARPS